ELYSERFLVRRPLLRAIDYRSEVPPVLLVDEVDRADDEFEAFLLEILSDYTITVPELATFRAEVPPVVVLTSNRTRDLHDALKRRCLYHWISHPDFERELAILRVRAPEVPETLARQVAAATEAVRAVGLDVPVGRAVTFAEALTLTGVDRSGPVYWAGRTTLLGRPEDIPVYDRAFDAFWRGRLGLTMARTPPVELTIVLDTEEEDEAGEGEEPAEPQGPTLVVRWSRQEVLRHKDFAAYTHAEFEEARRLMADLRLH